MRHRARWIAIGIGVLVAAFSVVLATQVGNDPNADAKKSQLNGHRVPAFTVRALDGSSLTRADLAGRSVIINFWNSWCIPCREELPALQEFYKRHADDPRFVMIGIVRDDTEQAVRKYVRARGIDWKIAFDPGAEASLAFGTRGQPETYAIAPDGIVVGYQFGPTNSNDLETLLAATRVGAR